MRSKILFLFANGLGLVAFLWPFFSISVPASLFERTSFAIFLGFVAILMIAAQISDQLLDSKTVAVIGVLAALIAALRLLGAGAIGIEPMWFLLILATRVFGVRVGYPLAFIAFGVSALLSGGVGPWLTFQMFAAGWLAISVGLIPKRLRDRSEIVSLAICGAVVSLIYGAAMDLQLWPWLVGTDTQLSFNQDIGVLANSMRFITFHFATAMAWDIPRSLITATLILLTGKPILNSLRRAELRLNVSERGKELAALSK